MHVWPIFVQLKVCGEYFIIFWPYLLKMCKTPIQIDGLDSCLSEEGTDARLRTFATHSARRLGFISFSVLFYRVTKSSNTYFKDLY